MSGSAEWLQYQARTRSKGDTEQLRACIMDSKTFCVEFPDSGAGASLHDEEGAEPRNAL